MVYTYEEICRLFDLYAPVPLPEEQIIEIRKYFGKIPKALENYYRICGGCEVINLAQDYLLTADGRYCYKLQNWNYTDYSVFYVENQCVSEWAKKYTGRKYSNSEIISFNEDIQKNDIDAKMQLHKDVKHIQFSCQSQNVFDYFIEQYADQYETIYFFKNPKVKDLSALSTLKNVQYLMFYYLRNADSFWDMRYNESLKGIFLSGCKKISYDISALCNAPNLEEFLLFSTMDAKYNVRSLEPLKHCTCLKRLWLDCKTEDSSINLFYVTLII